jgi:DNA polymerase-3 subunit beta
VLNVDAVSHALRRVALLSSERSRAVKFELSSGLLKLSSNNPDLGEAEEEIDVDYEGEALTIAFNARYLMDCLAACAAKEIRMGFQDELSPCQLVPTTDDDSLAVVMPMRV